MTLQIRSLLATIAVALAVALPASAGDVDVSPLQDVLTASVKGDRVDYDAVQKNRAKLQGYLKAVAVADVSKLKKNDKLAFYVNAYNGLVLEAVLIHKRPKKVLDVKGFFDGIKYKVAGEQMTLNELEEKKIRSLGDPRIHFVVNCASYSCPPLAKQVYGGRTISGALDRQSTRYLSKSNEIVIDDAKKTIEVVQLFNWYQKDFGGEDGARTFIAKYRPDLKKKVMDKSYKLTYREYDWRLNAAK